MTSLEKQESLYRIIVAAAATLIFILGTVFVFFFFQPSCSQPATVDNSIQASTTQQGCVDIDGMRLVNVLFDRSNTTWPYPLTVQSLMWFFFFICAGEVWVRWNRATQEHLQLDRGLLSENQNFLYRSKDLGVIYQKLNDDPTSNHFYLQRLVLQVVSQFQLTSKVDHANSIMASSLELMHHEVDLKYNMIRYLVWLIPTLGFIGTVIGIAFALSTAGNMPDIGNSAEIQLWVKALTAELGIAFNTTLVALVMSAFLVFSLNIAQGREERVLNQVGQHCLSRLLNRLVENQRS